MKTHATGVVALEITSISLKKRFTFNNSMAWLRLRTACAAKLLPLLLLLALPAAVQALDYTYSTNNSTITITGYTGSGGAVDIPSTIDGLPVTSIWDGAFYWCRELTSITIPNSVTSIGGYAFDGCTNLTDVTIGNSVTNIGIYAFYFCTHLTNVTIPNSVSRIGGFAFEGCTNLTSVTIPNSVANIGDRAFEGCANLTNVTIPNNLTGIGSGVFSGCSRLTSVTIPSSVTNIGPYAFYSCANLISVTISNGVENIGERAFAYSGVKSITIPNSVTNIGYQAFGWSSDLAAITVDESNAVYSSRDGVLFDKNQTTLLEHPAGKAGSYIIPNSVTNIGDLAFLCCYSLTNVTIPNSITSIGVGAFDACTGLTSVTIPTSVTSIGAKAFCGCTNLKGVYFKGNVPSVGSEPFYYANATVYYLPGATGWGSIFGGRPTALWKPQVQTSDANFGVRMNQFGLNITWASGQVIVVEACTNLVNPTWFPLQTNTLSGDSFYFSEPQWTNHPARFYRFRSP